MTYLILATAAVIVIAAVLGFIRWATVQHRRDVARILADAPPIPGAGQAIALTRPRPVWRMRRCGCTWMTGDGSKRDRPTVIICAGHWIDAYEACDYFYFEREIST